MEAGTKTGTSMEQRPARPERLEFRGEEDAVVTEPEDLKVPAEAKDQQGPTVRNVVAGLKRQGGDLRHEIEVRTAWAPLLDPEAAPTGMQQPDDREVYLVAGAFTEGECAALVAAAEEHGFGTTNYPKAYRGNLRLITTDCSLAEAMWRRLQPYVPATVHLDGKVWEATGLNECWRLSKYHPGDCFKGHCDACFERSCREMSMFTVNIYMNSDFEGGNTRFYSDNFCPEANLTIRPQAGLCLLFRQPPGELYYHDGDRVLSGQKYLFRSDVMYRMRG